MVTAVTRRASSGARSRTSVAEGASIGAIVRGDDGSSRTTTRSSSPRTT